MSNSRFKLYRSGIHLADVIFNDNTIKFKYRDVYTNKWSEALEYNKKDDIIKAKYDLDLSKINEIINDFHSRDYLNAYEIRLDNGKKYNKFNEESSKYSKESNITFWAERHSKFPLDVITKDKEVIGFVYTKREECTVLVKENYEKFTPQRLWEDTTISNDEYKVKHIGMNMITMRDGVKLATDIWLPDSSEATDRFPTILVRTPYGKNRGFESKLKFVQRGYALVIQDTRGREESEGIFIPDIYEAEDGDDSLNWIASQEWCDGNIGMIGGSYLGYVQWAAASTGNPHLKAIVSIVTSGSPFIDLPRKGGTMSSGMLAWSFAMSRKEFWPEAMERDDWDEVLKIRPIKDIPKKILGEDILFWNDFMQHSTYDEYWEKTNWSIHGDKVKVPSLILSGWFDDNGQGSLEAWKMNAENQRDNIKMILGPWLHKANSTRDIGEISFGNNAIRYDIDIMYQKWFDRYLKGIENGISSGSAVEYYNQGSNEWKESNSWTPDFVTRKNIYLDSRGEAQTSDGDGKLTWEKRFDSEYDTYLYNPQEPTPHLIDLSENELNVPANYKEVEKRKDILVYTSSILEEDLTIAGEVYAEIYAESSAKDTDWIVRLTDVDEQGNSRRLVDGFYRARYINNFKEEKLLDKGEIRKYDINMFHTANTFKKGHRIRVEVTSSAENFSFPNHNTGNDFATDTEYIVAKQKIYHSKEYPSHIKLPVVSK